MKPISREPAPIPLPVAIGRYGSRFWAVHLGVELIAVTVYKKGAVRVAQLLTIASEPPPNILAEHNERG
jgi:hypothetical protein